MRFDIISIFPHCLDSYFNESILKRAQEKKIINIRWHDLRDFAKGKWRKVDDTPYGGGPGMILQIEPLYKCLRSIPKKKNRKIILLDPAGQQFDQIQAKKLSKIDQLILIAGRYEGVDARLYKHIDARLSIGPYVLTGGELAAAVIIESVSRFLPGVLGTPESLNNESYTGQKQELTDFPQYSRPEIFNSQRVPKVLLSGNHKMIAAWRQKKRKIIK
jgi:tRNA (guanine-N1)-methyltransferase